MDTLRLLVTSDTHGGLPVAAKGECALPRLASALSAARGDRPTLLLDNGDTFFGGALVDHLVAWSADEHPVARFFSLLGYSAMNVGNEDLAIGIPALEALAGAHALPLLTSNVVVASGAITRNRIVQVALASGTVLKVGVLGTVPASACRGSGAPQIGPQRESAAAEATVLKRSGCDLIVALCHTGIDGGDAFPAEEAEALQLASVPGVAVVVAGHLHEVSAIRTGTGVPVVAPGSYGRHFGIVDLDIERQPNGDVRARCSDLSIVPTLGAPPDRRIQRLLAPALDSMRLRQDTVVGSRARALTTDFAPVVQPSGVRWMQACLRRSVREATGDGDTVVAAQCAGGRGPLTWVTIGAGPARESDVVELYPYRNSLELAEVDGATLLAWLEASAATFNQVNSTDDGWTSLIDESVPLCDHDFFSDVGFAVDLSRPRGSRIRDARWRGDRIERDARYRVAINSYRLARLAAHWPPRVIRRIAPCVRSILARGLDRNTGAAAPQQRRFLRPGPSPRLYFRATAPAQSPLPPWIRRLELPTPGSHSVYALETEGLA